MTTQPNQRRAVCVPPHNRMFLETAPGSGDYNDVTGQWAVVPWRHDGIYLPQDAVRWFKHEKTAQRYADRYPKKEYVVRTTLYMRLDRY